VLNTFASVGVPHLLNGKCDTLLSQVRQLSVVPINGGKYLFSKSYFLEKFRVKTDIFHAAKPIFFTSNWCKTDIFHRKNGLKRIFSENIPLLIGRRSKNPEKYIPRPGSGLVFPVKNITSGF
jgi:hypothetical protein